MGLGRGRLTLCIRLATLCAIAQACAMAHSAAKRIERFKVNLIMKLTLKNAIVKVAIMIRRCFDFRCFEPVAIFTFAVLTVVVLTVAILNSLF